MNREDIYEYAMKIIKEFDKDSDGELNGVEFWEMVEDYVGLNEESLVVELFLIID